MLIVSQPYRILSVTPCMYVSGKHGTELGGNGGGGLTAVRLRVRSLDWRNGCHVKVNH